MHELPLTAWMLMASSTVPWLVLAVMHTLRNRHRAGGGTESSANGH